MSQYDAEGNLIGSYDAAGNYTGPQAAGFFNDILGFLNNSSVNQALRTGGEYFLGREAIGDVQALGREAQERSTALAEQGRAGAEFKPYTVTSGLANIATTPEGGFGINLSPEQQALQAQLQGQAAGLFGQVGQDPAAQQAAIFEQIRATQRPEEERQRLALEERMLSQGRLGVSSAAYGGASPELLAMETARQEAMTRANLGARQQALAEQQQAAGIAGGLLGAGYMPQQQALSLLEASQIPAGLQQRGQLTGVELQSQLGGRGIESYMQGADLANRLQLQQQQGLMSSLLGSQPTAQEQLMAKYLGADLGKDGGLLGSILDYFTKDKSSSPSASASQLMFGNAMGLTPAQLLAGISGPSAEEQLALEDLTDY